MATVGTMKGSRLSKATKAKVMAAKKAGTITGKQAQAMRQSLRAGKTTGLANKTIGKNYVTKQVARSVARKAAKPTPGTK